MLSHSHRDGKKSRRIPVDMKTKFYWNAATGSGRKESVSILMEVCY